MGGFVSGLVQVGTAIAGINSGRSHARSARQAENRSRDARNALRSSASTFAQRAEEMWTNYTTNIRPHENLLIDELVRTASRPSDSMVAEAVGDVGVAFDKQMAISERMDQRRGIDTTDAAASERRRLSLIERGSEEVEAAQRARAQSRQERQQAAGAIYDLSGDVIRRSDSAQSQSNDINRDLIDVYTQLANRHRNSSASAWGTVGKAVNSLGGTLFGTSPAAATAGKPAVPEQGVVSAVNPDPQMGGFQEYNPYDPRGRGAAPGSDPGYKRGGVIPPAAAIPNGPTGGQVVGPGTGTSDSVPAVVDEQKAIKVSAGEYIIPAHIVRKKGTEFFDKLITEGGMR
jgi:hypothetical protein